MRRPSFQFYPGDWRANAKLRRCSDAARGAWVEVLCLLHDSDEYGVIRWPLADIARAAGVPAKLLKELASKGVLKGGDDGCDTFVYTPRHAGKDGEQVTLLDAQDSVCWYCSRFVRDEYIRQRRGISSQFSEDNQPPKSQPKTPFGDGSSSSSASASSSASSSDKIPPPPHGEKGSQSLRKLDNLPTTETALRISALYNRKPTTAWSPKEVRAFKAIGKIDHDDLELVCRYTEFERVKGDNGRHRRDLATFLNNFTGELDRARSMPVNGNTKTTSASEYGI